MESLLERSSFRSCVDGRMDRLFSLGMSFDSKVSSNINGTWFNKEEVSQTLKYTMYRTVPHSMLQP